jgi:peptide/nickel transport system ATP-binding protein
MLKITNLNMVFGIGAARNHAVKHVSLEIEKGKCFGLIGESGSGKSTVLNCITGLLSGWTGEIRINGRLQQIKRDLSFYRNVQMVFQDPYGSLHPRHTIDRTLKEPVAIHGLGDANQRVEKVLDEVGLGNRFRFRYPHQLSGGQRQRVAIARALILEPELILLDEPTSALDVSIQAEILNLLKQVQKNRSLTYLLVSHNLAVVSHMCHTISVMTQGSVVEQLTQKQLRQGDIQQPYTLQLMAASRGFGRGSTESE